MSHSRPQFGMTTALTALCCIAGCGGLVFPCSADLAVGDEVQITLADAWGYGTTYGWDAVNVWPREGPWCDGIDSLARGATIRLQVAELAVGWAQDNRGDDCHPWLGVVTSDIGVPLMSQVSGGRYGGNALLAGGGLGCDRLGCSGGWTLDIFVADDRSLFAPLVVGEPARVAVRREVHDGTDGSLVCTDIWAAEVRRVE